MVEAVRGGADMVVENAAELMDEIGLGDHKEEVPDDNESESDDDEDYYELDEDIMRRLNNNDPNIDTISVTFSPAPDDEDIFDASTFDWEKDGVAITENTHLKKLYTDDWHHEDETQLANAKAFCNALSKNRSIEHFSIDGWPLGVDDTCSILSPFFEHNTNLRSVGIFSGMDVTTLPIFTSALAKCKSLRKIGLQCKGMEDELAAELVASLSTHHNLKTLSLNNISDSGKQWCIALGNLLQNPESKLEKLSFNYANNYANINDEAAVALGGALGNGSKLKKLSLAHVHSITSTGWLALFQGLLTNTNSSLEELDINYSNGIDDKALLTFAAEYSISKNTSLKTLEICSNESESISTSVWGTLFRSLFNPVSVLEKLDLSGHNINDDGLNVLGTVLGNNSTLKVLDLGRCRNVTSAGWVTFFERLSGSQTSVLREFRGPNNNIDDEGLAAFANVVSNNPKLKNIRLYSNPSISAAGWQTFFTSLHNCDTLLEELYLWDNNINDAAVTSMVDALNGIESLSRLDLSDNPSVSPAGLIALSTLLQHPNSSLKDLTISTDDETPNINDEVAMSYANALVNNKSITTLDFGGEDNNTLTAVGWDALANVLCNKTSIESIYSSNHTLYEVGYWSSDSSNPTNLLSLLALNKDKNKSEVARQKIVQYHFTNDGKIEEFVDMEVCVMPHAISWIGRVSSLHSLLYNVVRGMPTLFDSDAKAKAVAAGIKRKIGCRG